MEIIKEGDPEKRDIERFTCLNCGCVFDAIQGEWKYGETKTEWLNHIDKKCKCPYCYTTVYTYEEKE